jgi:FAD/FMN-containing dehydrogenase
MISTKNSPCGFSRRDFLRMAAIAGLSPWQEALAEHRGTLVNDVHSALNPTWVSEIHHVESVSDSLQAIARARKSGQSLSICGSRHAAGGQQFLTDGVLLDTTRMNKILHLDREAALLTVQSGARWVDIESSLDKMQLREPKPLGINQKQTGLNTLTIGGTLSANAHGQGLLLKPFVADVESFKLINANGELINCNRHENVELFNSVIGGYGVFGFVPQVTLKLIPRQKVRRLVQLIPLPKLAQCVDQSISKGFRYGHCQMNIDETSPGYLSEGIFSTYQPVDIDTPITGSEKTMTAKGWTELVTLAHSDKMKAYKDYVAFYQATDGFINWSDVWQNSHYVNGYHRSLDRRSASKELATEVLSEFFVPISQLETFLGHAREYFLAHRQNIIFSTIRFIEKDDETLLPWARERYACVIFNFHTVHSASAIELTMRSWKFLIDRAIDLKGSFYLTYQHLADKKQMLTCYPAFEHYLALKLKHDPNELFQSDWYRWHKKMFA